jgi:hypothetical protein
MPASVTHEARKHSRPVGRITAKESPRKRRGERGQRRPTPPLHFFAGGRELLAQIVPASTPRETNTLCEPARGAAAESVPGMSRKGAPAEPPSMGPFLASPDNTRVLGKNYGGPFLTCTESRPQALKEIKEKVEYIDLKMLKRGVFTWMAS